MGRVVDIPWAQGVEITWVGGRNTMGRDVDIPWVVGVNIPCVGGSIYHG